MSKIKKDKEVNSKNTYDPQYISYFIQNWLGKMVVQYHVKHIQIQEAMAGTIITLIAESTEPFPNGSPEDFPEIKNEA
jgi:hypothetical protein